MKVAVCWFFAVAAAHPRYTAVHLIAVLPFFITCIFGMDDAWNELSFDFEPAVQAALPPASLGNTRDRFRSQVIHAAFFRECCLSAPAGNCFGCTLCGGTGTKGYESVLLSVDENVHDSNERAQTKRCHDSCPAVLLLLSKTAPRGILTLLCMIPVVICETCASYVGQAVGSPTRRILNVGVPLQRRRCFGAAVSFFFMFRKACAPFFIKAVRLALHE